MALQQLSPDWRAWLRENVARGCGRETLLPLLIKGGHAQELAERVLDEALPGPQQPAAAAPAQLPLCGRPAPDLRANRRLCGGQEVRVAALLEQPQMALFDKLLSLAECRALIALAEPRLVRSTVVDEQLGEARTHEHRSSAGAWFQRGETALLARIEARLAELLAWPVDHGEGLQVLRYGPGGEYRAHHDFFNPALAGSARHLQQGGQRVGTCILYLSEVEAGGGTRFPQLGFEVRPSPGAALYFADVDAQGAADPRALHAGLPVIAGVKYIATKWLRERAYGAPA
jgi:prolyl 4-hydroxylase